MGNDDRGPEEGRSRCRRRRSPGTASSSSATPAATSKAGRAICTRSTPRPARSSGNSFWFPSPTATPSAGRRALRRSTLDMEERARRRRSAAAGPGLPATLDPVTGLLYVPVGNPAPDYDIGVREGDNLYTDSVVVLDAKTGAYKNHYQIVRRDWHDWDVSNPPALYSDEGRQEIDGSLAEGRFPLRIRSRRQQALVPDAGDENRECRRALFDREGRPFLSRRRGRRGMEQPGLRPSDQSHLHRRGRLVHDGDVADQGRSRSVLDRATVDGREVPQSVQRVRKVHARRRRLGGMAPRRRRRHRGCGSGG